MKVSLRLGGVVETVTKGSTLDFAPSSSGGSREPSSEGRLAEPRWSSRTRRTREEGDPHLRVGQS